MNAQLNSIIPKLPTNSIDVTRMFYVEKLNFHQVGGNYNDYIMLIRDQIEIHFFLYKDLPVLQNYGMCYIRVLNIETLYNDLRSRDINFPELGKLEVKPWNQKEFSIIDNCHNLITFGEPVK